MSELVDTIFPYPARVLRVDVEARQVDLLALAKDSRAFDPAVFDERKPFFWSAQISNSNVDAYFTRMLPSTLMNFANDAKAGISFLNSHRHGELPFGRSLDGQMVDNGGNQQVLADFFTLPGLNINGINTTDFIDSVRAGVVSDISVGFYGGTKTCDICQRSFWECPHIPGMTYETKGSANVVRQQLATFAIDGARLAEVSAVYDGATPDATILKAQRMNEAGKLKAGEARALEARYHRTLFDNKRSFAGVSVPERKSKQMDFEKQVEQIRSILGVDESTDVAGVVMTTNTELLRLRPLETEVATLQERVKSLEPLAKDGERYRNDLVTAALGEGVRALGEKFDKKVHEEMLRAGSIDLVIQMKDAWSAIGNARFTGGRQSTDEGEQAPGSKTKRESYVPAAAYRS